jgi:hypothetical protein
MRPVYPLVAIAKAKARRYNLWLTIGEGVHAKAKVICCGDNDEMSAIVETCELGSFGRVDILADSKDSPAETP